MVKILVKGGIWKNTEDEILKVAVMKYGKNQWNRIASLLHRKTAKQCKARWYEWLDPGIKKTEWNREEDEKLLHLAKLMPTQWRTIAPMVGRTANQCLERYEYLLDQAQINESGLGDNEDPRKLRPGEVDPNPETKPARPDPMDMDEDELEMLAEARARLANTQGKKAKRKAREKQLDEARRLATLQKKRELRAAGCNLILLNKLKRCCDLNFEIPFEKKPAPGFYDTTQESVDPSNEDFMTLREKEYTRRDRLELLERRKDKDKFEKMKETDLLSAIKKTTPQMNTKRSKLILPSPQISQTELEEVVKLGTEAELAKSFVSGDTDDLPTLSLLNNYSTTPMTSERIPLRTPLPQDSILRDVQTLAALNMVDTPLKGGKNIPISDEDLLISKPKSVPAQTPNTVLASPYSTPGRAHGEYTPLRDNLSINKDSACPSASQTPINSKFRTQFNQKLRSQLSSLPKPIDDFEVEIPEIDEKEPTMDDDFIPDAADEADFRSHLQNLDEKRKFLLQPESIKRNLPIPTSFSIENDMIGLIDNTDPYFKTAQEMISKELSELLKQINNSENSYFETVDLDYYKTAKSMIESELSNYNLTQKDILIKAWEKQSNDLLTPSNDLSLHLQKQISKNLRILKRQEDKIKIMFGGYISRHDKYSNELQDVINQINHTKLELLGFETLQQQEFITAPIRLRQAQEDVEKTKLLEQNLQKIYSKI